MAHEDLFYAVFQFRMQKMRAIWGQFEGNLRVNLIWPRGHTIKNSSTLRARNLQTRARLQLTSVSHVTVHGSVSKFHESRSTLELTRTSNAAGPPWPPPRHWQLRPRRGPRSSGRSGCPAPAAAAAATATATVTVPLSDGHVKRAAGRRMCPWQLWLEDSVVTAGSDSEGLAKFRHGGRSKRRTPSPTPSRPARHPPESESPRPGPAPALPPPGAANASAVGLGAWGSSQCHSEPGVTVAGDSEADSDSDVTTSIDPGALNIPNYSFDFNYFNYS